MKCAHILVQLAQLLMHIYLLDCKYLPNWDSLDKRPLPSWYDEAKFGIFMHWGPYSAIGYGPGSVWFWEKWRTNATAEVNFVKQNYRPGITYADLAADFRAEFYDPDWWASLFEDAGAKYIVLTSKHHDGFTLWPSKVSFNWNAMDLGPKRDLIGDLGKAIRSKTNIKFGLYHSLFEWFNPLFLEDSHNQYQTQKYVQQIAMPELYEIVTQYKPEIVWSDGDWMASDVYWNSTEFLAWLYNESPVKDTVVTNDRWGKGMKCLHGGYWTCKDRYQPGKLIKHKWENCWTVDHRDFGYRRNAQLSDFYSAAELVKVLVTTVCFGGNLLLDVGPTGDGRITPILEERLRQVGSWLKVNGEAIYGTKPWMHQNDTLATSVWYTSKKQGNGTDVYAMSLEWPDKGSLMLGDAKPRQEARVFLLGYSEELKWVMKQSNIMIISVPYLSVNTMPCDYGWTFKIQGY